MVTLDTKRTGASTGSTRSAPGNARLPCKNPSEPSKRKESHTRTGRQQITLAYVRFTAATLVNLRQQQPTKSYLIVFVWSPPSKIRSHGPMFNPFSNFLLPPNLELKPGRFPALPASSYRGTAWKQQKQKASSVLNKSTIRSVAEEH